ncbi:MAG: rRNA maturation RNase YbeY [Candidatus Levybacteria bacterium CG_4_9_14_3_um_filter_35_16]|nr:MAG: rRNA maturation RNase YbeY [Candidatus Levybacteria bacterium CG22_combo_CG10-13_8_21_14_all_35_11]PIY94565.1 MAG: rRNA maturation RNase YbeY [Candidatus Levybacteria bacterium CG_4_10_14_0_8_um_filter_35_23]PIZ98515.1 MAG: rRNA maturation RNase YbeY [Candidatus Levybacteria bacterium CG_4_10_14_0_2_um_filter_35_8]PJA90975.1 MAG: rRNA maturation RNase YbeY [Candidatus Levybacteria bacterium CG_4_9_14_3_um_filter_35_16]
MEINKMNIKVPIFVESRYKVSRKKIKQTVMDLLNKQSIMGSVEISVAIIGDRKMRELSRKYKEEDKTRNVLSFSQTEGKNISRQENMLRLGDIVLSYPQVIRDAARDEMLVDDKVNELVEHGLMHLLGIHHE